MAFPCLVLQTIFPLEQLNTQGQNPGHIKSDIRALLQALACAHNVNVYHNDIAAMNILVNHGRRAVMLIDWGVSGPYAFEPLVKAVENKSSGGSKLLPLLCSTSDDMWRVGLLFAHALLRGNFPEYINLTRIRAIPEFLLGRSQFSGQKQIQRTFLIIILNNTTFPHS